MHCTVLYCTAYQARLEELETEIIAGVGKETMLRIRLADALSALNNAEYVYTLLW